MYCREDLRKLKRITLLWDYIRQVTEQNQDLLMGETSGDVVRRLVGDHHDRHPAILGAASGRVIGGNRLSAAEPLKLDVLFLHPDRSTLPTLFARRRDNCWL